MKQYMNSINNSNRTVIGLHKLLTVIDDANVFVFKFGFFLVFLFYFNKHVFRIFLIC